MTDGSSFICRLTGNRCRLVKLFLLFYLITASLTWILFRYNVIQTTNQELSIVKNLEHNQVKLARYTIGNVLQQISADLASLATAPEVQDYLNDPSGQTLGRLNQYFLQKAKHPGIYDQIRLLNRFGMEISRVNFTNGQPLIVPKGQLQDKSRRYYFIEASYLNEGEIYLSPLDLNIENDAIEQPYKPVMRFAIPVHDRLGSKQGYLFLNYLGDNLLKKQLQQIWDDEPARQSSPLPFHDISQYGKPLGKLLLANNEGYWLLGPTPGDEWGFILAHDRSFPQQYPQAWNYLNTHDDGQYEDKTGIFTFTRLSPLQECRNALRNTVIPVSLTTEPEKTRAWHLLSFIPAQDIAQIRQDIAGTIEKSFRLVFVLLLPICLILAYLSLARITMEANLAKTRGSLIAAQAISGFGSWEWDIEANIFWGSDELQRILGLFSHEFAVTFQGFTEYFHPADRDRVIYQFEQALHERTSFSTDHRVLLPSGEQRFVHHQAQLTCNAVGRPIKVTGTLQDITERKMIEKELRQTRAKALMASSLKSEFLANVSHEIRTPMNSILGMLSLLEGTYLNKYQREYIEVARDSAESLLSILNDVLDLSKIEAGKIVLEKINFNLRHLVAKAINSQRFNAQEKDITLHYSIDPDVPSYLIGDPTRLRQIILNLIGNAIKFTSKGFVSLSCKIWHNNDTHSGFSPNSADEAKEATGISADQDGIFLHFTVQDTGIGISQSKINEIFESFTQADGSITRKYGGTGLGLNICSRLVPLLGGRIWVDSTIHQGSTFHFTAGLGRGHKDENQEDPSFAALSGKSYAAFRYKGNSGAAPYKLLMIDHELANEIVVASFLREHGYEVTFAPDGTAALELMKTERFDLILTALLLPEMDGCELARMVRSRYQQTTRNTPILALAEENMKDSLAKCLAAGMDGYVSKPLDLKELLAAVDGTLKDLARDNIDIDKLLTRLVFDPGIILQESQGEISNAIAAMTVEQQEIDTLFAALAQHFEYGNLKLAEEEAMALRRKAKQLGAEKLAAAIMRLLLALRREDLDQARVALEQTRNRLQEFQTMVAEFDWQGGKS